MSWSGESDNHAEFSMAAVNKWNTQTTKIEQTLKEIRGLIDGTNRDFQIIKNKHAEIKNLEKARETLNNLLIQLSKEIIDLECLLSSTNNQNLNAQKIKVKEFRTRAAEQTRNFRDLCTNINSELKDREMKRKKEISIISNEFDYNEENLSHNDQMTVSDLQLREAEEELKQMEKINRDVIVLEDLFVNLNAMVEEQGEKIDIIQTNVENAYTNVDEGTKQLDQAVEYKKSALKKKLCVIGIIIGVLAVLALILGLSIGLSRR